MTPDVERGWWDGLDEDGRKLNAWGDPPYPVEPGAKQIAKLLRIADGRCRRILDLGCGPGRTARALGGLNPYIKIVGVDISPQMVLDARRYAGSHEDYLVGDGRNIPHSGNIHGAYSITVFEHIPHEAVIGYINQVAARLPIGGRFVFTTVVGDHHGFLSHHATVEQIEGWCSAAGLGMVGVEQIPEPSGETWFCCQKEGWT